MLCDRSNTGISPIDPGRLARNSGKRALTEFATSTALAPACRETASTTTDPGGLKPRIQNEREMRSSCTLLRTSATSQINRRAILVPRHDQIAISLRLIDLPVWQKDKG